MRKEYGRNLMLRFVLVGALAVGMQGFADAHDLWLIPPAKVEAGKPIVVRAVQGMDFPVGGRPPNAASFRRIVAVGPDGKPTMIMPAGTDGDASLLPMPTDAAGIVAVAVETAPKILTLEAEDFNSYLVSDGLLHIYRLRAKEKSLAQPGVERYSKSPKVLVNLGGGTELQALVVIGLPLEIVPMANPFTRAVGDTLRVRVLFQGKPLAGANLGWDHPGDGDEPSGTVRCDAKGEAVLPIAQPGLMTIRLTHMTRPKATDHEWESFWTTLTFRIGG